MADAFKPAADQPRHPASTTDGASIGMALLILMGAIFVMVLGVMIVLCIYLFNN